MGKTNKANRTKGNMRPSSSGHSAELLGPTGGFVGFAALGGKEGGFVPVAGDIADMSIDSDFRVVMRKMLKRDAVTRLKAVQEFGEYCVEKEKDTVKNVLPFWPRLFNRLVLDLDRRVRESTHVSNGKLLAKVGREVAPHLRSIMAAWLVGQCDPHAPASSAAKETFAQTFTQEAKRGEAVLFCKGEVMAYFKDNIFEQTAKTMSEQNPTSPEDMESKYNMVIGATLQALKLFLLLTTTTKNDNAEEEMKAIVQDGKFWKYAKNKESQIRGAWFSLVSSLCQTCPSVFEGSEKKLVTTVFGQLSESDPIVAPSVWESALSIAVNREDCWQVVDVRSVALPQLWLLLRGGGRGNASVLFPCLLPLISRLPKETAHSESFLGQLFSCLTQSLMLDSVKMSTSECDAILSAFFECLQFVCCTRLDLKEGSALLAQVINKEVIPLLSSSLHSSEASHLALSRLYPLLSVLLCRAEKKGMSAVVEGFWQQALPMIATALDNGSTLALLGYFFHSMLQTTADARREKRTVRFQDEEHETPPEEITPTNENELSNNNSSSLQKTASHNGAPPPDPDKSSNQNEARSASMPHIATFCVTLCRGIEAKGCPLGLLRLLEEILTSGGGTSIWVQLVKKLSEEGSYKAGSVPEFIEEAVLKWLWKVREDENCVGVLLNIVLLACSYLTLEEASAVLDKCCKVHVGIVEHVLRRGLASFRGAHFFREWLVSARCSSDIVQSLRSLVEGDSFFSEAVRPSEVEGYLRTITLCLLDNDTELLMDDASFQDVLSLLNDLSKQLFAAKTTERNTKLALNFIHDVTGAVMKNPKRCWKFEATEKLIYLLFSTLKDVNNFENSGEVLPTLFRIVDAAIFSFCQAREQVTTEPSLILKMAKDLNLCLHSLQNQKEVSHVKENCNFLLSSVHKALEQEDSARAMFVCHKLTETILPSPDMWKQLRDGLVLNVLPFFLKGKILCPVSLDEEFFYAEDGVTRLAFASDVVAEVLCKNALDFVREDLVLHASQLVWCLTFYRGTLKRLEISTESPAKIIEESCIRLLHTMPLSDIELLKELLFGISLEDASWALCLQTLGEVLVDTRALHTLAEKHFDVSLDIIEGVQKYMTRQVLIPYLPIEKKQQHFEKLLTELKDLGEDMKDLVDRDFCGKMGEVCCCLQDNDLEFSSMRDILGLIFWRIAPFLKECNAEQDDLRMVLHLQVESIFCSMVHRDFINQDLWDFSLERLRTLMEMSCKDSLSSPRSLLLLDRTLRLFAAMSEFIETSKTKEGEDMLLQWKPSPLSERMHKHLVRLFLHISMQDVKVFVPGACNMVLSRLVECMGFLPPTLVLRILFLMFEEDTFRRVVDLLAFSVRQLQLASHTMLLKVMALLAPHLRREPPPTDDDSDDDEKKDEYEKIPDKLDSLLRVLKFLGDIVESMLMEVWIGDACSVVPHTDSHRITLAYMLGWIHVLEYISSSPSQVRQGYATDLTERGLLPSLFANVFRLMPENPVLLLKRKGMSTPKKEDLRKLFLQPPCLNSGFPTSEEIESVACHVFAMALRRVPASIRSWWNNLDRKSADIVNNFTSKYVSSHLCVAEIQAVHENEKQFENLMVQARPGSREVVATYSVDECAMELCVTLPPNHPLGPVFAEKRGRGGVGQQEWRHWLMQLTTLLTYQNGSILDGLSMWKRNLDKKFEGVEECMICYMVLHSVSLKLPRLSCRVCRKKFHSACLYKWFRSSNNSTCPLCRNEFTM